MCLGLASHIAQRPTTMQIPAALARQLIVLSTLLCATNEVLVLFHSLPTVIFRFRYLKFISIFLAFRAAHLSFVFILFIVLFSVSNFDFSCSYHYRLFTSSLRQHSKIQKTYEHIKIMHNKKNYK